MQQPNKKQGSDIIQEIIEDTLMAYPVAGLIIGFYKQYGERGFLTKKQLQGLYSKASTIPGINTARLATLEAIIKKMPNRYKSEVPKILTEIPKDEKSQKLINAILAKYPGHKRVLFFKSKLEHGEDLSTNEKDELMKFQKILKIELDN